MVNLLECRDVSKSYGAVHALRNVSCALKPGDILAVTGPNGSGKSTLLECIAGLRRCDSGEILIKGEKQGSRQSRIKISHTIGVLSQDTFLYRDLTVGENLRLAWEFYACNGKSSFENKISQFDLDDYLDKSVADCSKGMAKRASLARALIHDPLLMIFDEPFANLDSQGRETLWNFIEGCKGGERAVVIATHDKEAINNLATRVLGLDCGRVC